SSQCVRIPDAVRNSDRVTPQSGPRRLQQPDPHQLWSRLVPVVHAAACRTARECLFCSEESLEVRDGEACATRRLRPRSGFFRPRTELLCYRISGSFPDWVRRCCEQDRTALVVARKCPPSARQASDDPSEIFRTLVAFPTRPAHVACWIGNRRRER